MSIRIPTATGARCPRRSTRSLQSAIALLLATTATTSCGDSEVVSPAHATKRVPAVVNMAVSPTLTGVTVEGLARSSFLDQIDATFKIKLNNATRVIRVDDPSQVVVAKVTFEPNGSLGWHTHPGPAIATVLSGELSIINASDCVTRRYPAGKAFIDPGQGNVHIGFNASATNETIVYVTFLDVPPGQPATIPTDDPGCS